MQFSSRALGVLAMSAVLAGCSSNNTPTASASTTLGPTDANFVTGAGQASNAEIAAATLAMTKSTNPDVLSFAKEMITDHTQQNNSLKADTANDAPGAPAPGDVNAMQAAEAQKLMTLTGSAFDGEYVNSEITAHMNNYDNNYTPELASGGDATLVSYAKQFGPQVQMHLTMVQAIKTKDGF